MRAGSPLAARTNQRAGAKAAFAILAVPAVLCLRMLQQSAVPTYDAGTGALLDAGMDLNIGGIAEYYKDIIFISEAVLVLMLISDRFFLLWLVVCTPLRAFVPLRAARRPDTSRPSRGPLTPAGSGVCAMEALGHRDQAVATHAPPGARARRTTAEPRAATAGPLTAEAVYRRAMQASCMMSPNTPAAVTAAPAPAP